MKVQLALALLTLPFISASEAAMKQSIQFTSQGQVLQGDLYLPEDYQQEQALPGVVVTGSWTSVKEQMAGTYAQQLADKGYAALAFDFRGWGTGAAAAPQALQYVEHPEEKRKDILAAIAFLRQRSEVNSQALATLGICASAGYAIDAAHESEWVQSVATVAPWLHNAEIVDQVYGEAIPTLLEASQTPTILTAASHTDEQSVMYQVDYYTNPERGAIASYDNKFSTLTWQPWLHYDAIETAKQLRKPALLVHSEAAAIPQGAKAFKAQAGSNVQLLMLDNATQFDFYDDPKTIQAALSAVHQHFQQTLQ